MGILSDCFLSKTLIYLWNFSETSFFASTSDFTTSSSLFQISHSSTTLFTSIVFFFICLFFCFSAFSSCFFSAFSLVSSSFCFCYPSFLCFGLHCFPHFSGHLVILTSPILQSISGLWQASYNIPIICLIGLSLLSNPSIFLIYIGLFNFFN